MATLIQVYTGIYTGTGVYIQVYGMYLTCQQYTQKVIGLYTQDV